MTFNEKLMELRKANGWSQEELGDKLNVSRQTISKWELGSTTPEMEKLIELSRIFGMSIDELVGNEVSDKETTSFSYKPPKRHFEYVSKAHVGNLPLVHINIGFGAYKASGIIAIGMIAMGILSIGIISLGVIAFGVLCLGLLALGGFSAGALAVGGICAGVIAVGGAAIGYFAVGGFALGIYSVGGCAVASRIALGGYANAHIAIGDIVNGVKVFHTESETMKLVGSTSQELRKVIFEEFPNTIKIIADLFCRVVG